MLEQRYIPAAIRPSVGCVESSKTHRRPWYALVRLRRLDAPYVSWERMPAMLSAFAARWRYQPGLQKTVAVVGLGVLAVFLIGAYHKAYRPGGYDVHCFL